MDDRTMLELAAKAAGIEGAYIERDFGIIGIVAPALGVSDCPWNPLENDGQALRLAVKCEIDLERDGDLVVAWYSAPSPGFDNGRVGTWAETLSPDPYAATRRAISRAAAEIQLAKEKANA